MNGDPRLGDRIAAWRVRNSVAPARLLPLPPLPLIGDPARAEALMTRGTVWDLPDAARFGWLDDLVALGDERAGRFAARMASDWAVTPATDWTAEATGWRLLRWLAHARFLHPRGVPHEVMVALARQDAFLARRWQASRGWGRMAALAGLHAAAHAFEHPAPQGTGPLPPLPHDPDDLARALVLLVALRQVAQIDVAAPLAEAANRLRHMRHCDGRMTGLRGPSVVPPSRLDAALVAAAIRPAPPKEGDIARLARGRSSVLMDLSAPFAFEMTVAQQPLIVTRPDQRADLRLEGQTLSPRAVAHEATPASLTAGHDGWRKLRHLRSLALSPDGRTLSGRDELTPRGRQPHAVTAVLTFPLAAGIRASHDGAAIRLALPDGTFWHVTGTGLAVAEGALTLTRRIDSFPACIDWTFSRSGDTPSSTLPTGA